MGILPLQYLTGQTADTLGITGKEIFDLVDVATTMRPRQEIRVQLTNTVDGSSRVITLISRLDSNVEIEYYRQGGILPAVLRKLAAS